MQFYLYALSSHLRSREERWRVFSDDDDYIHVHTPVIYCSPKK